jgi:hypothetical protein
MAVDGFIRTFTPIRHFIENGLPRNLIDLIDNLPKTRK